MPTIREMLKRLSEPGLDTAMDIANIQRWVPQIDSFLTTRVNEEQQSFDGGAFFPIDVIYDHEAICTIRIASKLNIAGKISDGSLSKPTKEDIEAIISATLIQLTSKRQ